MQLKNIHLTNSKLIATLHLCYDKYIGEYLTNESFQWCRKTDTNWYKHSGSKLPNFLKFHPHLLQVNRWILSTNTMTIAKFRLLPFTNCMMNIAWTPHPSFCTMNIYWLVPLQYIESGPLLPIEKTMLTFQLFATGGHTSVCNLRIYMPVINVTLYNNVAPLITNSKLIATFHPVAVYTQ